MAGHRTGAASPAETGFTWGDRGVEHCDYPETGLLPASGATDEVELLEASPLHSELHEKLKKRRDVHTGP